MKVLFRVDGYPEVGLGHIIRSQAIAVRLLQDKTHEVIFAGRYSDEIPAELQKNRIRVIQAPESEKEPAFLRRMVDETHPDTVFIDTLYPYSDNNIKEIKQYGRVILFHNLCGGRFSSDVFILPTAHHSEEILLDRRWAEQGVDFYHGFEYIPVNEAVQLLKQSVRSSGKIEKIAITSGGSDPKGVMISVLTWLMDNPYPEIRFTALPGTSFVLKKELEGLLPLLPSNIHVSPFDYHQLANADLVISTFGVTSYELLYLGIPFISISHAKTNAEGSRNLQKRIPLIKDLGLIDRINKEEFIASVDEVLKDPYIRYEFKKISSELMDGQGISRIIDIILNRP